MKAFTKIHIGSIGVSGSQVPSGSLEIYFGPERQPEDEKNVLRQSIEQVQKYDQAQKSLAALKKAKQNTSTPQP
jgi:hypothetical protein